jgi:hypothetical protein
MSRRSVPVAVAERFPGHMAATRTAARSGDEGATWVDLKARLELRDG